MPFYVKKKISPKKLDQVLLLGDKSFIQEDSIARVYPNGNLFSHVIGQIDNDNNEERSNGAASLEADDDESVVFGEGDEIDIDDI